MDHLDEVELFIFLLVVQASAHVYEVDVFSPEGGHFALHVQVFEQCEVVRFKHTKDVANWFERVGHIFFIDLLCLESTSSIQCQMSGSLLLKFIFLLLMRLCVSGLLHLEQIVLRNLDPKIGPLVLDEAMQALKDDFLLIDILGQWKELAFILLLFLPHLLV